MNTITNNPYVINGKRYTLWPQLVEKKAEFIGGTLEEYDRDIGRISKTTITDITFEPNGKESAMFTVHGEDFSDSCDVTCLGVETDHSMFPDRPDGCLAFSTSFGTTFRITPNPAAQ